MKRLFIAACFLGSFGFDFESPAAQIAASDTLTIDTRFTNIANSAILTLETRPWDGASDSSNSGLFTLDARTTAPVGLAISGPTSVIGGGQAAYSIQNAGVDVSIQATLGFTHAPVTFAGIGGNTLFTYPVSTPQLVYLLARYHGPGGQIQSASFPVAILPNAALSATAAANLVSVSGPVFTLAASASASGGTPPYTFNWDTDNNLIYGDHTGPSISFSMTTLGETHRVRLKVLDSAGGEVTLSRLVPLNKAPVSNEPVIVAKASEPAPPGFFLPSGAPFVFSEARKGKGFLVITHGMRSSANALWLRSMASSIENQLGANCPNILLFDWSEDADPHLDGYERQAMEEIYADMSAQAGRDWGGGWGSIVAGIGGLGGIGGYGGADLLLDCLWVRFGNGTANGRRLADWMLDKIASEEIDVAAPIQLIGHSAGGYVVGQCGWILDNNAGLPADLVTMLDTPFPDFFPVFELRNPGWLEKYVSSFYGSLETPDVLPLMFLGNCRWDFVSLNPTVYFSTGELGHGWAYTWYSNTVLTGEDTGFYHSPFSHGPKINRTGATSSVFARASGDAEGDPPPSALPDVGIDAFETFGTVAVSPSGYTITEQSNAGLTKQITIPDGAVALKFRYHFVSPGDGDFLTVSFENLPSIYIGEDLPISRDAFLDAVVSIPFLANKTGRLTFALVSRGAANAVVAVENIAFQMSDDPDGDGLTLAQEQAAGTSSYRSDSDGDTLSDATEINTHFTNPMVADSDGDGASDSAELTAGTSPTNGQSFLRVTDMTKNTGGTFTLRWPSQVGRFYNVQRSADVTFATFDVIGQGIAAAPPQNTFVDTSAGSAPDGRFFYRVEVFVP